jgi:hypothetical protein
MRFTARLIIRQGWTGSTAELAGIRTPLPCERADRAVVTRGGSPLEGLSGHAAGGDGATGVSVLRPHLWLLGLWLSAWPFRTGLRPGRRGAPGSRRSERAPSCSRDLEGAGEPGGERVVIGRGHGGPAGLPRLAGPGRRARRLRGLVADRARPME